jgi:hypothetical protein
MYRVLVYVAWGLMSLHLALASEPVVFSLVGYERVGALLGVFFAYHLSYGVYIDLAMVRK